MIETEQKKFMGWMNELGDFLKKYDTANSTRPESEVQSDFDTVAEKAPPAELSEGISDAFRSESTPPFENMVSNLFEKCDPSQKAALISLFMPRPGSPLDRIVQQLGLHRSVAQGEAVSPEAAMNVEPGAIRSVAAEAKENDPSIMDRAGRFFADHPSLVKNIGGAALAVALSRIAKNKKMM